MTPRPTLCLFLALLALTAKAADPPVDAMFQRTSGNLLPLVHDEGEGYCNDGTNHYVMFRTHLLKIANDEAFASGALTLLASNMNTVAALPRINHCGGIKYYDGLIYCTAENYQRIGEYSQQTLALYRADTLEFVAAHSLADSRNEASGLAIIPRAGRHGLIIVTSYDVASAPEARELSLFDLKTFQFAGYLVLDRALTYMQDATFNPRDERLYIVGDGQNIMQVTLDGKTGESVYSAPDSVLEGLDFFGDNQLLVEVNNPAGAADKESLFTLSISYRGRAAKPSSRHHKLSVNITQPER